jgi:hypothetical protein
MGLIYQKKKDYGFKFDKREKILTLKKTMLKTKSMTHNMTLCKWYIYDT